MKHYLKLFLLFGLISLLAYSCSLLKHKKEVIVNETPTREINNLEDLLLEVNEDNVKEPIETVEYNENFIINSPTLENAPKKQIERNKLNKNIHVVNKTQPTPQQENDNYSTGTIAYSYPNEMQVGNVYQIKLRLTKQIGTQTNQLLILGERNIPIITDTTTKSTVTLENIRVGNVMSAQLIAQQDYFDIIQLNTEKQAIEKESYTEWTWNVYPIKGGETFLRLIIKLKIETNGQLYYRDIIVFDKNIQVKSNAKFSIKKWLSKYWQWLITTIIIPILIYAYKKRKKNKE